ncbi:hypothetical protein QYE76_042833 [Lolium multiflorum]|uniref:RRM domain-containing protein n=1 Tax=Lolium multiflorum TaxID=4521 RepID=A0AAD8TG31_LOLMU|nr:hypothetical protein QYE76_042833 [Lolium multiflorum]
MDQPAAYSRRRPSAPGASSSPALPSPPPPHHHLPLPLPNARPPPPPPSLPLPSALLPPKKRLDLRPPRNAATPIPPPPPPPPKSCTPATPVPSPDTLPPPAPSPPPPVADSGLSPPPPPPVPEEDAAPSARLIPAAYPNQPSKPPAAPDAATKPAPPTRKVRKVVRKVIVKKILPKGTLAARKAAAAAAAAVASDGAENSMGEVTTAKPATDHNVATDDSAAKKQSRIVARRPVKNRNAFAASSALGGETPHNKPKNDQHATTDNSVDKEQDADERVVEKLATHSSAAAVVVQVAAGSSKSGRKTLTGKLTEDGDQCIPAAKEQNGNEATVEKLATTSCKEMAVETLTEHTLDRKTTIECNARAEEWVGMSERQRMSMKEVFVGGLDRGAKEEDVRAVFGKAGEITQVRMIMDGRTRRNKGYCFVQYREAAQAKNAIAKFDNVKICGKFCRTAAPVGNDSISLENINKKWKKDVKSVFVEGIPSSWGQTKLTEIFKNYGKIEDIFLSRDTQSSQKRGCACIKYMTHEAAIFCLESFDKEELTENGSKVNIKVSLSKPVQRSKQNKEEHTFRFSESVKTLAPIQDHRATYSGEKRPCSTLDGYSSDRMRSHSRPRRGSSTSTTSTLSDNVLSPAIARSPLPSCHGTNRFSEGVGSYHGVTRSSISSQIRQVGAQQLLHPNGRWTSPKI